MLFDSNSPVFIDIYDYCIWHQVSLVCMSGRTVVGLFSFFLVPLTSNSKDPLKKRSDHETFLFLSFSENRHEASSFQPAKIKGGIRDRRVLALPGVSKN